MELVERHIVKDNLEMIELCRRCKNLYNQSLYYWRQMKFGNIEKFTEYELSGLFCKYNEPTFKCLPSNTAQQVIRNLFKNITSYNTALKAYFKSPSKFQGKPKIPKYKKELSVCYFTKYQVRIKNGFLHFPKKTNLEPLRTLQTDIVQVRLVPKANHIIVEIVYNFKEPELIKEGVWMGIDLGLNNLAACVTPYEAFIVNGRPLKSINSYYNKRKSFLSSKLNGKRFSSRKLKRVSTKRNNKVQDYLHKASKLVLEKALQLNVMQIIIGKNENWKQSLNLGAKNNRDFHSIPHARFINMLSYKAKKVGIDVITVNEAYTSKCSALDLESVCKQSNYQGKRISRGIFRSNKGILINADVNGALNIARLNVADDEFSDSVLSCALQPKKFSLN